MCGVAGIWTKAPVDPRVLRETVSSMATALTHRGPDGSGVWIDAAQGLGLGHRRLAILDLSDAGAQPMVSHSGRYVLTYNGEVYNFRELRSELRSSGFAFESGSDTEVLLAAFECWGVARSISRFVGMFAFAVWDRTHRVLHLVRDRLGIKPLYYGRGNGSLLFCSDLSSVHACPDVHPKLDPVALRDYFQFGCVTGTRSIYQGFHKVAPGNLLTFSGPLEEPVEHAFWSAISSAERGMTNRLTGSGEEILSAVSTAIHTAVRDRLVSDVPVGCFLSGGYDSTVVAAAMQAESTERIKTFTIGFDDPAYDEAVHAREVARHLGTEHFELIQTPQDLLDVVPRIPEMFSEPFADSSQIPTYLVAKMARRTVTVVLSGDGGDELFGGYNRHVWAPRFWRLLQALPMSARRAAEAKLYARAPTEWDEIFGRWTRFTPSALRVRLPGDKLHKLASSIGADSPIDFYFQLRSLWKSEDNPVLTPAVRGAEPSLPKLSFREEMMLLDLVTYLPDDILPKVDRATMALGLEARLPLLDHRLLELAHRVPPQLKVRRGVGKWLLRRIAERRVPAKILDRPKMGFGMPIDRWLRGPLRPWAEALLSESALRDDGILDPVKVRRTWREHLEGRRAYHDQLWIVLMFQVWREHTREAARSRTRTPRVHEVSS